MKNRDLILNSFSDKDSKFEVSKILDLYELSKKTRNQVVTEFLTPVILSNLLDSFEKHYMEYNVESFGGYELSERRCLVFNKEDYGYYDIDTLEITNNLKFNRPLEHREVLGSILGLGITRSKIGDIVFQNDKCYVFVKSEISDYIVHNLEFVGRCKIKIKVTDDVVLLDEKNLELKTTTVSSLRVDTIISNITNLSRNDVKKFFDKEQVFINWRVCNNTSAIVNEGDTITIRKVGRIRLVNIKGMSKKGKQIIDYYG